MSADEFNQVFNSKTPMIGGRQVKVIQSGMGFAYISTDPGIEVGDYELFTLTELAERDKAIELKGKLEGAKMALLHNICDGCSMEMDTGICQATYLSSTVVMECKKSGWLDKEARRIGEGQMKTADELFPVQFNCIPGKKLVTIDSAIREIAKARREAQEEIISRVAACLPYGEKNPIIAEVRALMEKDNGEIERRIVEGK